MEYSVSPLFVIYPPLLPEEDDDVELLFPLLELELVLPELLPLLVFEAEAFILT